VTFLSWIIKHRQLPVMPVIADLKMVADFAVGIKDLCRLNTFHIEHPESFLCAIKFLQYFHPHRSLIVDSTVVIVRIPDDVATTYPPLA
jgi:hypothetical protein